MLPLPIACSTRGCISTKEWRRAERTQSAFTKATDSPAVAAEAALTTLLRQHLVHHALLRPIATAQEAQRYRVDILNLTDEAHVLATTGLSLAEYDLYVLVPFLEQEALREQRGLATAEELYTQLAAERYLIALPLSLQWDPISASVKK